MICFPLFEGEQITQILLGLFSNDYFLKLFSLKHFLSNAIALRYRKRAISEAFDLGITKTILF